MSRDVGSAFAAKYSRHKRESMGSLASVFLLEMRLAQLTPLRRQFGARQLKGVDGEEKAVEGLFAKGKDTYESCAILVANLPLGARNTRLASARGSNDDVTNEECPWE